MDFAAQQIIGGNACGSPGVDDDIKPEQREWRGANAFECAGAGGQVRLRASHRSSPERVPRRADPRFRRRDDDDVVDAQIVEFAQSVGDPWEIRGRSVGDPREIRGRSVEIRGRSVV